MPRSVNMHDAKTHLSALANRAAGGEEIVIARNGRPVAKLVPFEEKREPRKLGLLKGKIWIGDDFDDYDEEIARMFESEAS